MQDQLVSLFKDIFNNPNNEARATSESIIDELSKTEDFYSAILSIIVGQFDLSIQREALIVFMKKLHAYRRELTPELKNFFVDSFVNVIPRIRRELIPLTEKSSNTFVSDFFFNGEWDNLPSKIIELAQTAENIKASLILTKSICKYIKQKPKNSAELHNHIVSEILPSLLVILESGDYVSIQMLYHCANRLLRLPFVKDTKKFIASFFEPFIQQLKAIGLSLFQYSSILLKPVMTEEFAKLSVEILKFLNCFILLFKEDMDQSIVELIVAVIQSMFSAKLGSNSIGKTLALLDGITNGVGCVSVIDDNATYFIEEVFSKFFVLKQDELQLMENDPPQFVSTIHKMCSDWSDPRASVHLIIRHAIKRNSEVFFNALLHYVKNVLNAQENSQSIFSALHLFSAAVYKCDSDAFSELLPTLLSICDSPDFILRASAFLVFSNAVKSAIVVDALPVCIQHIFDEYSLVSYYAALSISFMFDTIENSESKEEYLSQLQDSIEDIIHQFLQLGQEFQNEEFTYSMISIISFFHDTVAPFAIEISNNLLHQYVQESIANRDNEIEDSSPIPPAINTLTNALYKSPGSYESLLQIFTFLLEVMSILSQNMCPLEDTFRMASKIVSYMPTFVPDMWLIFDHITTAFEADENLLLESAQFLLGNLILKDKDISSRDIIVPIIEFLRNQVERDIDNLSSALHTLAGLCVRLNSVTFIEYAHNFIPYIVRYIEDNGSIIEYNSGIDSFVSAIIYEYGLESINIFGDMPILELWCVQDEYPFLQQALIRHYDSIHAMNSTIALQAMASAIRATYDQIRPEDDKQDISDDIDGEMDSMGIKETEMIGSSDEDIPWFTDSSVVISFNSLINRVSSHGQFQLLDEIFVSRFDGSYDLSQCMTIINEYALKGSNNK